MKKIFFLVAFLLFFYVTAFPATIYGTLKGRVTDEKNRPIPGATVRVLGTTRGAYTKTGGSFKIVNIVAGTYEIKFSFVGKTNHFQRVQIKSDAEMEVNAVLTDTVISTNCVVVCGYNKPLYNTCLVGCGIRINNLEVDSTDIAFDITLKNITPNPANTQTGWHVNFSSNGDQTGVIELTDYSGNFVWREERIFSDGENFIAIPAWQLRQGWYVMRIQGKNHPASSPLLLND